MFSWLFKPRATPTPLALKVALLLKTKVVSTIDDYGVITFTEGDAKVGYHESLQGTCIKIMKEGNRVDFEGDDCDFLFPLYREVKKAYYDKISAKNKQVDNKTRKTLLDLL